MIRRVDVSMLTRRGSFVVFLVFFLFAVVVYVLFIALFVPGAVSMT